MYIEELRNSNIATVGCLPSPHLVLFTLITLSPPNCSPIEAFCARGSQFYVSVKLFFLIRTTGVHVPAKLHGFLRVGQVGRQPVFNRPGAQDTPNLRRGRDEKLPLLSQSHFTGEKLWIVVVKQSQVHEKNKVKVVSNYYRLFFSHVCIADECILGSLMPQ
jgi:hypothetical protein